MESHPAGTASTTDGQSPRSTSWALPFVLAAALTLFAVLLVVRPEGDSPSAPPPGSTAPAVWTPTPRPEGETVSMTIDFGNGARREFDALPWSEGLTLGQLMRQTADFRPGLTYTQTGAGDMSFLTSLEGVANEARGSRNWFYAVDDARGKTSFEVQPLQPGDRILWVFKSAD